MLNQGSDDKRLSEIMSKSILRMPFTDFDDKVMAGIYKQVRHKKIIFNDARLSCLFFVLGTGFGLGINYLLSHASYRLLGFPPEQVLLFFQLGFVFFLIMQLERILMLFRSLKRVKP